MNAPLPSQNQLRESLKPLESLRLEYLRSRTQGWVIICITFGAMVIAGLIGLSIHPAIAIIVVPVGLLVIGIVYHHWIGAPHESFRQHFKRLLVMPLIETVASDVHYLPDGHEAIMNDYRLSELYSQRYDRCSVEDTVYCMVGATNVRFSEVHTEYKSTTTQNGKQQTHWHTIFQGIFLSADFHKDFHGKTFVQSDFAESAFGALGRVFQKPIFSSLELIQLEDPEFEQRFVVRATNQVEARYILTPKMMQQMTLLQHRFGTDVEFSFVDSRMFIAISTDRDFFEPDASRSVFRDGYLDEVLSQVQLCFGLIDELDLNRRIWTKQ